MKTLFKFIPCVLLTAFLNVSCSEHCDDEDYTRDEQEEAVLKRRQDSLKVISF